MKVIYSKFLQVFKSIRKKIMEKIMIHELNEMEKILKDRLKKMEEISTEIEREDK